MVRLVGRANGWSGDNDGPAGRFFARKRYFFGQIEVVRGSVVVQLQDDVKAWNISRHSVCWVSS